MRECPRHCLARTVDGSYYRRGRRGPTAQRFFTEEEHEDTTVDRVRARRDRGCLRREGSGLEADGDVEFVIPYGLGGGADLLARVIIKIMNEEKMVPVPVNAVNKPGGGASVGVAYVLTTKNANPNTLVLFNPQTQITPLTVKDARGWRDLTPVTNLMLDDYLLFVGKDSPYKNAGDLVKDAKAKPPKTISVGSAGTADDMAIAVFESAAGIKLNVVRFNSGGEALTALLGGHVNMAAGNPLEFMGYLNSGQVRPLGVFRPPASPTCPTCRP